MTIAINQIQMRASLLAKLGMLTSDLSLTELMNLCYIKNNG